MTDTVEELLSSRGRQGPLLSPTLRTPLPSVTDATVVELLGRALGGGEPGVKRKENEGQEASRSGTWVCHVLMPTVFVKFLSWLR